MLRRQADHHDIGNAGERHGDNAHELIRADSKFGVHLAGAASSFQCVKKDFTLASMIEGLQEPFEKGSSAKVQKALTERALRRLDVIDIAKKPEALKTGASRLNGGAKTR